MYGVCTACVGAFSQQKGPLQRWCGPFESFGGGAGQAYATMRIALTGLPLKAHLARCPDTSLQHLSRHWITSFRFVELIRIFARVPKISKRFFGHELVGDHAEGDQRDQSKAKLYQPVCRCQRHPKRRHWTRPKERKNFVCPSDIIAWFQKRK